MKYTIKTFQLKSDGTQQLIEDAQLDNLNYMPSNLENGWHVMHIREGNKPVIVIPFFVNNPVKYTYSWTYSYDGETYHVPRSQEAPNPEWGERGAKGEAGTFGETASSGFHATNTPYSEPTKKKRKKRIWDWL